MEKAGDRIRRIRLRKGITQADLAQTAGIDQSTLSLIETGGGMSAESLMGICARLAVSPEYVMYGIGNEDDAVNVLWPFQKLSFDRWNNLDPADKGHIQRVLMRAVDDCYAAVGEAAPTSFASIATPVSLPKKRGRKRKGLTG